MKKSREIIGLTVVSIQEGKEIGIVNQLVIDATTGSIAALLIDDGKWYLGAKVLPFSSINGLGEYAVTINSEAEIISVTPTSIFGKLMDKNINVIGSTVLTRNGNIDGVVAEILIDIDGRITECLIDNSSSGNQSVLKERIITFGKDVLIISDENEALPLQHNPLPADTLFMPDVSESPILEPIQIFEETGIIDDTITADLNEADQIQQDEVVVERETDELAKMFEEKQRKYLLGKTASRRIEAENGLVVVEQDEEITEEVLQRATLSGKFVELSMSIY